MDEPLSDAELDAIAARCAGASPAPWKAWIEGRDHVAGDTFIQVAGGADDDMYVDRSPAPPGTNRCASAADLDFIAEARQDVPLLLAEVRRLRAELAARDHPATVDRDDAAGTPAAEWVVRAAGARDVAAICAFGATHVRPHSSR